MSKAWKGTVPHHMTITEETYIEDLIEQKPDAVKLLLEHGVKCVDCGEPLWDKLGNILIRSGKDIGERKRLLALLNEL